MRDFHARHRAWISSNEWKAFRRRALAHYRYRCAVCRLDYSVSPWQLIVDHKRYWKDGRLIFGRETFADVRVLCPSHNLKGVHSDTFFRQWRNSYLFLKAIRLLPRIAVRVLRALIRRVRR